ncbi:MAG TPA: tetratricopeptide repeat protein [Bacteroidales bacterium]|nr:tetratricopeptide repeat protein [Bacteroidales bacterium]
MTVLCLFLLHTTLLGQQEREYIRKGNRLYRKSEFAGSEGMYRRAQAQERSTYDSGFNLGDALYKQGRFGEAAEEFNRAATGSADDSVKQAQSFYNLGNSLLKDQKFEESIKAYINSLMLDPENPEAKYNLAYAQDQLKKQEEQQQQQQNDQQQDKNKQDEEKKDDQKQKDDQQQKQQDQNDQQEQQGQDQQQQSISREDAKRLLDALSANEKETQEKVQRDKAARAKVRVIKNW